MNLKCELPCDCEVQFALQLIDCSTTRHRVYVFILSNSTIHSILFSIMVNLKPIKLKLIETVKELLMKLIRKMQSAC